MRLDTISTRTEALQNLWLGGMVWNGVSSGLLGKGPAMLGQRHTWIVILEHRGVGLGASRLGSQFKSKATFCVCAEMWGRDKALASSFVLKIHLPELCLSGTSSRKRESPLPNTLCIPSILQITPWPLKLQSFSPTGSKNSWISAPFIFPASGSGEVFFLHV